MNTQFSSHASNFGNALQTQVDPRTGQFMVNFPVARLVGNHQLGPDLSLSLRYSPLNTLDEGFGTGFSLGLTQFNNTSNLLQLTSGEQYRVAPGSDKVRNKKLNNFRFVYTNGRDDSEGYTVFWKEGKTEKLTKTEDGKTFVTTAIISPLGRRLTLSWDWSGQISRLSKVQDENTTLCQIIYGTTTKMTVWPGTTEAYQLNFELINDSQLDVVSRQISDSETLRWHFIYDEVKHPGNRLTLTGVDYPTGMKDSVDYNAQEGLRFPDSSGLSVRLPCVLTHTRNPGSHQPETVTQYEYTAQNFLGYNGNFGEWAADSDYLYKTLTDYTYGSTEKVISGNVTVTTERTYNNYHFLITEEVNRNGHVHRTETTYYAEKNCFIDGQPAQFQLPKAKKEIIKVSDGSNRQLLTLTEFDESGNPLKQVNPDGTVTEYTWYPANGEKDVCPAEPNGFVRFLKEKVITPRPTIYKDTPLHTTKYTYSKLGKTHYVVQKTVSEYKDKLNRVLLTQRTITYQDDINKSEFGRITFITDTKYKNGENSEKFIARQDFTTSLSGNMLNQEVTFTGYEGLKATSKRCQSVFSGQLYSETSAQGIETRYAYDKLGRLINRTVCPGSDYESTTTWEYGIDNDGPYSTEIDALGNKNKTCFDGAGRVISQHRYDLDTQKWYETFSCSHNSLGEISTGTVKDYLPAGNPNNYPLKSDITYGGWGEKKAVAFSDGRKTLQKTDPIALTQTVYSQGGDITSGNITSILDEKSQLPIKKILQENIGGQPYSLSQYTWDGLGQLREEKDELGHITKRTYDEYGRVLAQTLADGTIVSRTYAPHLTGNQVASISVEGKDANGASKTWALGTQTFDSLGRVTERVSGGRKTLYHYEGASPVAKTITLPSGKEVTYTYIAELGNAVKSMTVDGITQTFNYDKKTGQPLTAEEASAKIQNAWSKAGRLKEEAFSHNTQNRTAKHTYTLKGAPISYTDVAGKQTQYSMDAHGRVTLIDDDSLTVSLKYDALGRLSKYTVRSKGKSSDSYLTTELSYDAFGREITRTIKDNHSMTLALSQTWLKNGLLNKRITKKNGTQIREEQYGYDSRNRLISYTASGSSLPTDPYGHLMTGQNYTYDALNNLTSVFTWLSDSRSNKAVYSYENSNDPTQLTKVTNSHLEYPATISLTYDAEGRMTRDEAGRTLTYDVMGRLISVSDEKTHRSGTYSYDALNRLITRNAGNSDVRELYYRGAELVNEVNTSANKATRLIKTGHTCLGVSDDKGLTLTAGDKNDSLLWSEDAGTSTEGELHVWSPYGSGKPSDRLPGFNGERVDPVSGTYHLGNGYRAYNPVLMRFNCPDSLSPFGAGGINPYAYCAGDPINHTDPSGHLSWQAITGIVAGAIGLGLAVFTAGSSIAAAGGVMAALSSASASSLVLGGLGVASDITGIASGAMEDSNPEASSILGWASLTTGLAGMAVGIGMRGINKTLGVRSGAYRDISSRDVKEGQSIFGMEKVKTQTINPLKRAPEDIWHEIVTPRGNRIYGANRTVTDFDIDQFILYSLTGPRNNSQRPILLLTGAHGDRYGYNWVKSKFSFRGYSKSIYRDPDLNAKEFSWSDKLFYSGNRKNIGGFNVSTKDIRSMTIEKYESILMDDTYDIVLGFCYGRNDEALRYMFNLPPVISYIKN